jgi:hypothetical protein
MFKSKAQSKYFFNPGRIFLLLAGLCSVSPAHGQQIIGFWGVDKVTVGEMDVTPVAKWFRINGDGTAAAGNGWLQNWKGTWTFDDEEMLYMPESTTELIDEFGAFKVSFPGNQMTWQREEEGMHVTVLLSRIAEMPMSPADEVRGLWGLETAVKDGKDIMESLDPDNRIYFFIRWDRLFQMRKGDGTKTFGFWHMDGHEPKFFLVNFDKSIEDQVFTVSFEGGKLVMRKEGEEQIVYTSRRLLQFPD